MTVRQKEDLARFAVKKRESKAVYPRPPLKEGEPPRPNPEQKRSLLRPDKNMKLSVSHLCGLDDCGVIEEGLKVVEWRIDGEALYGWLEFDASDVRRVGLGMEYDNDPPRHAHVVGWPEDSGERRSKGLNLALRCMPRAVDPALQPSAS